jgi:hypothetical protein
MSDSAAPVSHRLLQSRSFHAPFSRCLSSHAGLVALSFDSSRSFAPSPPLYLPLARPHHPVRRLPPLPRLCQKEKAAARRVESSPLLIKA